MQIRNSRVCLVIDFLLSSSFRMTISRDWLSSFCRFKGELFSELRKSLDFSPLAPSPSNVGGKKEG